MLGGVVAGHQWHPAGLSRLRDSGNVLTAIWTWEVDALCEKVCADTVALPPSRVVALTDKESDEAS